MLMKKQLQLFLALADEIQLSACLKAEIPGIVFLNDNVWTASPDCRDGIEECDTGRVYLYAFPLETLPLAGRKNGDLEGPIAGCVVQILRTTEKDRILLSGRIAAGIDDHDDQMRRIVDNVWTCLRHVGKAGVVRPDGRIDRNYLVGHHALRLLKEKSLRIADRAIGMYYEPTA